MVDADYKLLSSGGRRRGCNSRGRARSQGRRRSALGAPFGGATRRALASLSAGPSVSEQASRSSRATDL